MKPLDGPAGPSQDFTDLHAWAEVYLPGAGWVGLDPTSGLLGWRGAHSAGGHAEPGVGGAGLGPGEPEPGRVPPRDVGDARSTRTRASPSRTPTRSGATSWRSATASIEELAAGDVRLTMGGEPTFVSIDDMDGDEWNTAAMGPDKRRLGRRRSSRACATPLRRAACCTSARASGTRASRCRAGRSPATGARTACRCGATRTRRPTRIATTASAQTRRRRSPKRWPSGSAVGREHVIAAYEDPLAYIHKERQLPVNVDPEHNTLDDPEERERLRGSSAAGLAPRPASCCRSRACTGKDGPAWQSGLWMLRARAPLPDPGDSPVGFRLPLESLPAGPAFEVFRSIR